MQYLEVQDQVLPKIIWIDTLGRKKAQNLRITELLGLEETLRASPTMKRFLTQLFCCNNANMHLDVIDPSHSRFLSLKNRSEQNGKCQEPRWGLSPRRSRELFVDSVHFDKIVSSVFLEARPFAGNQLFVTFQRLALK